MSGVKGLSQPEAKRVPVGLEKSLVASIDGHTSTSIREPNWARQESQWLHAGPSTASEAHSKVLGAHSVQRPSPRPSRSSHS